MKLNKKIFVISLVLILLFIVFYFSLIKQRRADDVVDLNDYFQAIQFTGNIEGDIFHSVDGKQLDKLFLNYRIFNRDNSIMPIASPNLTVMIRYSQLMDDEFFVIHPTEDHIFRFPLWPELPRERAIVRIESQDGDIQEFSFDWWEEFKQQEVLKIEKDTIEDEVVTSKIYQIGFLDLSLSEKIYHIRPDGIIKEVEMLDSYFSIDYSDAIDGRHILYIKQNKNWYRVPIIIGRQDIL